MDSITLQNYRCFGSEEQTARLAPLTLLVGPNSTGKTSFLALIRALWDVAFREVAPNFREEPFDLGSFGDIVHSRGSRTTTPNSFAAGFEYCPMPDLHAGTIWFDATFEDRQTSPFPVLRRIADEEASLELRAREHRRMGKFQLYTSVELRDADRIILPDDYPAGVAEYLRYVLSEERGYMMRPVANAPIRSRPHRTYNPIALEQDIGGAYVPSYLAGLYRRNPDEWQLLRSGLENFGQASGLFDEISVRSSGKSDGDPFQIQIRKFGKRRKGPWRNLIDVGYGISQALPILTELLRSDMPTIFLLQQPEVHLHPQAQAALGTLFCQVAAGGRQLVVETHSDYIIDRVRMDVRDGKTDLKPEDVSVLYFEPRDLHVKIHSIRIDQAGNVLDAPLSYGKFFMAETRRSIGL